MKKNYLFFVICVFLFGCSKRYEGFDMTYRKELPKAIPAGASTFLSHYFLIENILPQYKSQADANAKNIIDVTKIVPKAFRMSAKFGDVDLNFIREVVVNIYPHNDPNKRTEVFYNVDIQGNTGPVLILNPGLADVKKILSDDNTTYDMEIRMFFRGTPPTNIETVVDYSFIAVTGE
jgi:hypothetical protein